MCQEQLFQALQGSWNLVLDSNIRVPLLHQGQDEAVRMDTAFSVALTCVSMEDSVPCRP